MEIFFYHLTENSLDEAIAKLINKAIEQTLSVLVRVPDKDFMVNLSQKLWARFILHGTDSEAFAQEQPVLLTTERANLNKAKICFLVNGADYSNIEAFDKFTRVGIVFSGDSAAQVSKAREQWQDLKQRGYLLSYFQQKADGRWVKNVLD